MKNENLNFYPQRWPLFREFAMFAFSFWVFASIALVPEVSLLVRPICGFVAAVSCLGAINSLRILVMRRPWLTAKEQGIRLRYILGRIQQIPWSEIARIEVDRRYEEFDSTGDYKFLRSKDARLLIYTRPDESGESFFVEIPGSRFSVPVVEVAKKLSARLSAAKEKMAV